MSSQNREREWLKLPMPERQLDKPAWWGISLGSAAYGVKALTADEAVCKAQRAYVEKFGAGFPLFIAELHGENVQFGFDERYPDRDTVLLIPFSMVEYPEDPSRLTPEQTEAFDRLR